MRPLKSCWTIKWKEGISGVKRILAAIVCGAAACALVSCGTKNKNVTEAEISKANKLTLEYIGGVNAGLSRLKENGTTFDADVRFSVKGGKLASGKDEKMTRLYDTVAKYINMDKDVDFAVSITGGQVDYGAAYVENTFGTYPATLDIDNYNDIITGWKYKDNLNNAMDAAKNELNATKGIG